MSQANSALALSNPYAGQALVAQPQGYPYAPVPTQNQPNQPMQNDRLVPNTAASVGVYESYSPMMGVTSMPPEDKKHKQVRNPGEVVAIATLTIDGIFLLAALAIFNGLPFGKRRGRKPEDNYGTIEYRQQREKAALENFNKKFDISEKVKITKNEMGAIK